MTSDTQSRLFQPLTIESAPEDSKPVLERIGKGFGFIPNLMGTFANSPAVLKGYLALDAEFENTFSPVERQVILLTASVENLCAYCTAAHATILKSLRHVPADVVAAIRSNRSTGNIKYDALAGLTREIVAERGYVRETTIEAFLAAGYRKEQVMEILLGVALKTISNYLDHLSPSDIDQAFVGQK
ncbi:MAG: carboxymuconolactone decarboxylase family protein [Burkholderiales bacterium]